MNTETQNLPSFKVLQTLEGGLNSKQPSSVLAPRSVVVWEIILWQSIDGLHPATIGGPADASMWLKPGQPPSVPERMCRILEALRFE